MLHEKGNGFLPSALSFASPTTNPHQPDDPKKPWLQDAVTNKSRKNNGSFQDIVYNKASSPFKVSARPSPRVTIITGFKLGTVMPPKCLRLDSSIGRNMRRCLVRLRVIRIGSIHPLCCGCITGGSKLRKPPLPLPLLSALRPKVVSNT